MEEKFQIEVYAVKHKNEETRYKSQSGGAFTAISDKILSDKGIVYGCILNEKFEVIHARATNINERDRMRGSKYVQSDKRDIYLNVFNDLSQGKEVLFSGTSCEIAGLRAFLGKEYSNLFCVDIVCHGVPSPLIWKCYLEWQEQKNRNSCIDVDFRNKREFGWRMHIESLTMKNGRKVHSGIFKTIFYEHSCLRPSCYKCPFKDIIHPGDITIADYWGIEKVVPQFDDNRGVSLVLVNNEKGREIFEQIKETILYSKTCIEDCIQEPLKSPFTEPENRELFWKDFLEEDFEYIARKYGKSNWKSKVKCFLAWLKMLDYRIRLLKNFPEY